MEPVHPPATEIAVAVEFVMAGQRMTADMRVPATPTRTDELLPIVRGLADTVVECAAAAVEARGEKVSCASGCGACCRQLVPLSLPEARALAQLVESLPEPRQTEIRRRFRAAHERLEAAGVLARLCHPEQFSDDMLRSLGDEYFGLGIPCPFLEEESCSIYPDRPLACREYLVTSPAACCARPTAETIRKVPLPARVSTAYMRIGAHRSQRFVRWTSLILALEGGQRHPDETPLKTGPELVQELFRLLSLKDPASAHT